MNVSIDLEIICEKCKHYHKVGNESSCSKNNIPFAVQEGYKFQYWGPPMDNYIQFAIKCSDFEKGGT